MRPFQLHRLPLWITRVTCLALLVHGPVAQLDHYHDFADRSSWFGMPHAADVPSNLGFAFVALWGMLALRLRRAGRATGCFWSDYC